MSHPVSLADENRVEHKLPSDLELDVKETGDSGSQEVLVETKGACASEEEMRNQRNTRGGRKLAYSTTSSVYAKDTLLKPDTTQVNYW